ncbi:hypothetical protein ID866_11927, partial [Astraeus odoratus]
MRAELMQVGNTYVEPNTLISMPSMVISVCPTPILLLYRPSEFIWSNPDLTVYLNSHLCEFAVNMPTHTMQTCLCAHTQTKCKDAKHYLSSSCQIPSTSDHHPPLSTHRLSPTTPHQEPHIRTLAKELEDTEFRTPDGPGGNDPDPGNPNDPDGNDGDNDNASDPSVEDNPILALTHAITLLSHATRCRPEDSGAAHTKVHEPDTFDGTDPKKLCEFLVQCELNFHNRLQAFRLDVQKVGFALSFLKGITLAWFEPDLLDNTPGADPTWVDNYSKFIIKLTTNFSPHNP